MAPVSGLAIPDFHWPWQVTHSPEHVLCTLLTSGMLASFSGLILYWVRSFSEFQVEGEWQRFSQTLFGAQCVILVANRCVNQRIPFKPLLIFI